VIDKQPMRSAFTIMTRLDERKKKKRCKKENEKNPVSAEVKKWVNPHEI
jgi:folate-dependent tRNA-U54 methylase TrmFO/GidA